MAFQSEIGSGQNRATSNHDLLNSMVSMMTSRHVATVAINNQGTGYVVGDILTLTHGGAHLDARFEVTGVTGGLIDTMIIQDSGAFGDRPNGTITITAGGTGYAVSASDVILELQSGVSRCPTKLIATTNGSGVVTSALDFEDLGTSAGGVYSTLPTYPAATVIKGPDGTAAGTGCTITMGGATGTIPLTGQAVTGGTGSSATVDITLAETGWAVDGRNDNDRTINGVTNEKTVVLKGDATGLTNKPFVAYLTGNATSGINTRFAIGAIGLIAHNPALDMTAQSFRSPNLTTETTLADGGAYILCASDTGSGPDLMDFWISVDDQHISMVTQIEAEAAVSDNGVYIQHYAGLMDRIGTETEAPYPFWVFGSGRLIDADPLIGAASITGMAENRMAGAGCSWFYDFDNGVWRNVQNDDSVGTPGQEQDVMLPVGRTFLNGASTVDRIVEDGTITIQGTFFKLDRTSATRVLRLIPGTVDQPFLWPLTVSRKPIGTFSPINDKLFGQPKGVFWITSDNGSGARITDYSEDFVTASGDRYVIFHNHVHIEPYQYIAIKRDV